MSTDLIQRSLCDEGPDYTSLAASLATIKNLICCNSDGLLEQNTGYEILKKLFLSGNDGEEPNAWFDVEDDTCGRCGHLKYFSCFDDRIIYYYGKDCKIKCKPWKPKITPCIENAIELVLEKYEELCDLETFKELADAVVLFIAHGLDTEQWEDILTMINALCELIKQRVFFDKTLRKSLISDSTCNI